MTMEARQHSAFQFMCMVHEIALDLVPTLSFNKKHPWHLALISLYGSMIELLGSACILIRENVCIGVPILLRSLLEAHVDFVNLAKDRRYGYHMKAAELHEWIGVLEEAQTKKNPFLKGLHKKAGQGQVLRQWQQELRELKNKGYHWLSISDKFKRARLKSVYRSVYNFLCCDSHNNIRALNSRHVNIMTDTSNFSVEFYHAPDADLLLADMDMFCSIAVYATNTIHKKLKSGATDQLDQLTKSLRKHRKEWKKN